MLQGHYCVANSLSPATNHSSSRGYWAGLLWATTNPAPGKYDFSELETILEHAATACAVAAAFQQRCEAERITDRSND